MQLTLFAVKTFIQNKNAYLHLFTTKQHGTYQHYRGLET